MGSFSFRIFSDDLAFSFLQVEEYLVQWVSRALTCCGCHRISCLRLSVGHCACWRLRPWPTALVATRWACRESFWTFLSAVCSTGSVKWWGPDYDDVFIVTFSSLHSWTRFKYVQNACYKGFFVFMSMTTGAGMALFLLGVRSTQFLAVLLLGDDSFDTFTLKYGCAEAL